MRLEHETAFDSEQFRRTATKAGIVLQFSGVESQNSQGVGERYHGALRRVYNKVVDNHPLVDKATALRLAIKSCNDTLGVNVLVKTLLVFGTMPALPTTTSKHP